MQAVTDLSAVVGIRAACDALGLARAAFYRHRPRPRLVEGPVAPTTRAPWESDATQGKRGYPRFCECPCGRKVPRSREWV